MDKKNLGTISLLSIVLAISLLLAGCSSLMYYFTGTIPQDSINQYEQIKLDVDSATSIDDFTKLAMDAYHLFETYPELSYSVIQASINSRLLNLDIPYQCESTGELYLNFVPTQQQVVSKTIDSQDITILISWYDTYRSESIRCEIDIPASICQVFNSIVQNVTEIAISEQDITVLISWGEPYLKEIQEIYGEQSSHIVHDMIQQTIGAIENSVVSDAVAAEDPKLISDYFLKDTCKGLVGYELCSEQDMKQLAQTLIAQKIEQQVYDKAVREENPSIYTDAYPKGSFDSTKIPDDKEGRAFKTALDSLENAEKFMTDFPDSNHMDEIMKYILMQEWLASDIYKQAISELPQSILDSYLVLRDGILDFHYQTFKEVFLDNINMLLMGGKMTYKNDVIMFTSKGEAYGEQIKVTVRILDRKNGTLYLDYIKIQEGWTITTYKTWQDKLYVLLQMLVSLS